MAGRPNERTRAFCDAGRDERSDINAPRRVPPGGFEGRPCSRGRPLRAGLPVRARPPDPAAYLPIYAYLGNNANAGRNSVLFALFLGCFPSEERLERRVNEDANKKTTPRVTPPCEMSLAAADPAVTAGAGRHQPGRVTWVPVPLRCVLQRWCRCSVHRRPCSFGVRRPKPDSTQTFSTARQRPARTIPAPMRHANPVGSSS